MGHELHLKGLPENSDFFQLLKTSSDPGEFLSTLIRQTPLDPNPWILEDPDYMCEESRQLLRAYDAMRQSHSNLGTFYTGESGYIDSGFDLDRRYEILVYVLSEAFRRDRSYTGNPGDGKARVPLRTSYALPPSLRRSYLAFGCPTRDKSGVPARRMEKASPKMRSRARAGARCPDGLARVLGLLAGFAALVGCDGAGAVDAGLVTDGASRTDAGVLSDAGALPDAAGRQDAAVDDDAGAGCVPVDPSGPAQARTESGVIEGTAVSGGVAFLGVPFAAPPIGSLRLAAPEPPSCWSGVRRTNAFGAQCPQVSGNRFLGDEDCLTLNVWTPTITPTEPRPVLVFLHGGFNLRGSSSAELGGVRTYDGAALAQLADAVVVTPNYRLGALGFLAHPSLATAGQPSGNYALRDQIAALEWVRNNIRSLGGDPDNVTLFGQSAGSIDTCALLAVPAARGLFHRAMMLSGACVALDAPTAVAMGDHLVSNVGCADASDVAACLRSSSLSAETVARATFGPNASTDGAHPTVDGVLLPSAMDAAFAAGNDADVPTILSSTTEEMTILATGLMRSPLNSQTRYELATRTLLAEGEPTMALFRRLGWVTAPGPIADRVLAAYPYGDYPSGNEAFIAFLSDVNYVCPGRRTLRALRTGGGATVHRVVFDGSLSGGALAVFGPSHGIDVVFGFRSMHSFGHVPDARDLALADHVGAAWAGFARTGTPVAQGIVDWPPFPSHVRLGATPVVEEGFRDAQCDFWDSLRE